MKRDRPVTPGLDFEDLVARIEAMDPDALAPDAREEAAQIALHARDHDMRDEPSTMLAPFIAAARAEIEQMGHNVRAPTRPPPARRRRAGLLRGVGLAAGLAAAAGIVAVAAPAIQHAIAQGADVAPSEFGDHRGDSPDQHAVDEMTTPAPSRRPGVRTQREISAPDVPDADASDVVADLEDLALPEVATPSRSLSATERRTFRIRRMQSTADQAWKAGDLDDAVRALREIIQAGGHRIHAEYAYADLLSIARQRGDETKRRALRREYLMRFPNGRFADDVLANRCRSTAVDRQSACWQDYVRRQPLGSHLEEARRELQHQD